MPNFVFSPGDYGNVKYWWVQRSGQQITIRTDGFPRGSYLFMVLVVGTIAGGLFWGTLASNRNTPGADDNTLPILMGTLMLGTVLACIVLPGRDAAKQRKQGSLLTYDAATQIIDLPRQRLSLKQSQIIEFRILHELPARYQRRGAVNFSHTADAVELQIEFKNPNIRRVTLIQTLGQEIIQDVVDALKEAKIAPIVLAEKDPDSQQWTVQEI
ncbi:MAG TPA: hypothetical protein VL527_12550 [Dongiaceae bacterium]|jgi:hypothetical protein|nr:hypothetical protein [Dongiaceae bacterium]